MGITLMRLLLALLLLGLGAGSAAAQNFGNIKPHTVLGNVDTSASRPAAPMDMGMVSGQLDVALWGAPVTGNAPAVGADATPAIAACLEAVSHGICRAPGRYTLLSDLVIPAYTVLKCRETHATAEPSDPWNSGPAILLASGVRIKAGGPGAGLLNCNVLPSGRTIPLAGAAAYYPQIAVSDNGNTDFHVTGTMIGGFNSAIQVSGKRPNVSDTYLDGAGVTTAVLEWDVGNTDSGFVRNVKIQYIVSSGSCANSVRPGTGLRVAGSPAGAASVFMDNVVAQGFLERNFDFRNNVIFGNLFSDGISNSGCASSYPNTQVGVYVGSGVTAYGGSLNINQSYTGLVDASNGPTNSIAFVSVGQSLGDCLQLGSATAVGFSHFPDLTIGACGLSGSGHAINFVNAGSRLISNAWVLGNAGNGTPAAPYIVASGPMLLGRGLVHAANITTDLPGSGVNGVNVFDPARFTLGPGGGSMVEALGLPLGPVSAQTGGTASIVGTEQAGVVSFTAAGGSPTGNVTISPLALPIRAGVVCMAAPTDNGTGGWAAGARVGVSIMSATSLGFIIVNGATPLSASPLSAGQVYTFGYHCDFL